MLPLRHQRCSQFGRHQGESGLYRGRRISVAIDPKTAIGIILRTVYLPRTGLLLAGSCPRNGDTPNSPLVLVICSLGAIGRHDLKN